MKQDRFERSLSSTRLSALGCALLLGLCATSVACGDDDEGGSTSCDPEQRDAGDSESDEQDDDDQSELDAGSNSSDAGSRDAGSAPSAKFVEKVAPKAVPLSTTLGDRLVSATFARDGKLYAAGFTSVAVNEMVSDQVLALARFTLQGELDKSFSDDGIATVNVGVATTASDTVEMARGVAVQSDGKIVIAGTAWMKSVSATVGMVTADVQEHNVVVARFKADGSLIAPRAASASVTQTA